GGAVALKALLLAESGIESPASRCRVIHYVPHLLREGIDAEVVTGMPSWGDILRKASAADVVLVQRRALPVAKLFALRAKTRRLVFDFDDSIWLKRAKDGVIVPVRLPRRLRLRATLRRSDAIVAGNSYLAAWAGGVAPGVPVSVLATPIEAADYARATPRAPDGRVVIGWVGAKDNLRYLDAIAPALQEIVRRHPQVVVRVVCNAPWEAAGVPVENVRWSLAEEIPNIAASDLGVMPLEDDDWTRGKCGFKAIQFLGTGQAVVCSPVGMNVDVVTDGENGFLARGTAEWVEALEKLVVDPALRRRMGGAGRERVARAFDARVIATRLAGVLRGDPAGV
ncbi:MAG TPA: glycosyltransferase family 4 protein, partial [bacterium]|nr:glycosyltransferase family 4 protein [bacterium]